LDADPAAIQSVWDMGQVIEPDILPLKHFKEEDGAILDIGAHWGYTAASIRHTGTQCPIVSFEAMAANSPSLDRLRSLDPCYDFCLIALSDKESLASLYTLVVNGRPLTGINSIDGITLSLWHVDVGAEAARAYFPEANDFEVKLGRVLVKSLPLDSALQAKTFRVAVDKIAAIKTDVEGHEAEVIRGARSIIAQHQPLLIIEGAAGDLPAVREVEQLGYLPANRDGDQLFPSNEFIMKNNYYFYHPSRLNYLQSIGVIKESAN
jgi:FkbM family methyltransferase